MRKILLPLLLAVSLSACSEGEVSAEAKIKPEDVVAAFLAESWDEGETMEDYLAEVDPYLNDPGMAATRSLLQDFKGPVALSYGDVKVDRVSYGPHQRTAKVNVNYTVTLNSKELGVQEQEDSTSLTLTRDSGAWLISE